jgi:hypothetical protein
MAMVVRLLGRSCLLLAREHDRGFGEPIHGRRSSSIDPGIVLPVCSKRVINIISCRRC